MSGLGPDKVTVISGPSGVGKGTVVARLLAEHPELWVSVSATTRSPRPQEIPGVSYIFVTEQDFDRLVAADELLEWAVVHKVARYGTPRQPVIDALERGQQVILEIDLAGARQVRKTWPDAKFVFLEPPSWDVLVSRLAGRGSETQEQVDRRLATARVELAAASEFDHVIVNDELSQTVEQLVRLLGLTAR